MAPKKLPPARKLRQLFDYDQDSGTLTRKPAPRSAFNSDRAWAAHKQRIGEASRSTDGQRYVRVCIEYSIFKAHRIIWKMVTGREPPPIIDHINRNTKDDRWCNLRQGTSSQSNANRRSIGRSLKGAHFRGRSWESSIQVRGHYRYLGTFPTEAAAHAAYCEAGRKAFGEFFHPG